MSDRHSVKEPSTWHTTVSEVILIFRDALCAIAPVLERAHIHYEEELAYDDWDSIAQSLYENVVERSVQASSQAEHDDQLELPKYAMEYREYSHGALILVEDSSSKSEPVAFYGFASKNEMFDITVGVALASDFRLPRGTRLEIPIARSSFKLLIRRIDDNRVTDRLDVSL